MHILISNDHKFIKFFRDFEKIEELLLKLPWKVISHLIYAENDIEIHMLNISYRKFKKYERKINKKNAKRGNI